MTQRDPRVFDELMGTIRRIAYSVCSDLRLPFGLQEDVAQDVALKVFRNWQQFNVRSKLSTWIYAIARNHCLDVLRSLGPNAGQSAAGATDADPPTPDEIDHGQSDPEQRRCVQAVLAALEAEPAPRAGGVRKIDLLRHWVEHSPTTEELAAFLKTTVAAAKERKRYVLEAFRTLCLKHCGTHECGWVRGGAA